MLTELLKQTRTVLYTGKYRKVKTLNTTKPSSPLTEGWALMYSLPEFSRNYVLIVRVRARAIVPTIGLPI